MCVFLNIRLNDMGLLGFDDNPLLVSKLARPSSRAELKIGFLRLSLNGDGDRCCSSSLPTVAGNDGVGVFFNFRLNDMGLLGVDDDPLLFSNLARPSSRAELKIDFLRLPLNGDGDCSAMTVLVKIC